MRLLKVGRRDGGAATFTVSAGALGGFTGTVNLSATGLPSGATAVFTPASISGSGTSSLVISTASNTPLASYAITLTGSSGALTRSTPVTVVVGSPDFTISVNPSSASVLTNASVNYTVTIAAVNGFSGGVNLSAIGLPIGSTITFNPTSVSGAGTSTATVTTGTNTPTRGFPLVFVGTSGTLTHTATATLSVTPKDFGISLDTSWMIFPAAGGSATRNVTITPASGFVQSVTLSATNLPAGATASFDPPAVGTSGTSVLTVTLPSGVTTGLTSVNVVGTVIDPSSGSPSHSIPLSLVVQPSGALPSGWINTDLGSPAIPGSAGYSSGVFTIQGSGSGNNSGTSEQLNFTYQTITGDTTVVARVTGVQNAAFWSNTGLMIRQSLAPDSSYAYIRYLLDGFSADLFYRPTSGGAQTDIERAC